MTRASAKAAPPVTESPQAKKRDAPPSPVSKDAKKQKVEAKSASTSTLAVKKPAPPAAKPAKSKEPLTKKAPAKVPAAPAKPAPSSPEKKAATPAAPPAKAKPQEDKPAKSVDSADKANNLNEKKDESKVAAAAAAAKAAVEATASAAANADSALQGADLKKRERPVRKEGEAKRAHLVPGFTRVEWLFWRVFGVGAALFNSPVEGHRLSELKYERKKFHKNKDPRRDCVMVAHCKNRGKNRTKLVCFECSDPLISLTGERLCQLRLLDDQSLEDIDDHHRARNAPSFCSEECFKIFHSSGPEAHAELVKIFVKSFTFSNRMDCLGDLQCNFVSKDCDRARELDATKPKTLPPRKVNEAPTFAPSASAVQRFVAHANASGTIAPPPAQIAISK